MTVNAGGYKVVRKRVATLKPSPENRELYRSPYDDPDIREVSDSTRKAGIHEPLIITQNNFIVSGHRRHAALKIIGQAFAPCRVLAIRRASTAPDEYIALLREHNRQRH